MKPLPASRRHQRGTTAVEFAIVALLFFTLLIGIMEMGRLLWTWNAAVEATRLGARLAVVCDKDAVAHIKTRMQVMLPALESGHITISYLDPGNPPDTCTSATCKSVQVRLAGYTHVPIIPLIPISIPIPPFQTTLPRESMDSTNPECGS